VPPISTQPIYHQTPTIEQAATSGLGILESQLSNANITDILVNGHILDSIMRKFLYLIN
jgi:hypothetical protein